MYYVFMSLLVQLNQLNVPPMQFPWGYTEDKGASQQFMNVSYVI